MKKLVYYRKVESKGLDFSKEELVTVPNQAMTLQEIIKRFTRKQSLPIEHEGIYADVGEDLEKLSRADLIDRFDFIDRYRDYVKRLDDYLKRKAKKEDGPPAPVPPAPPVPPPAEVPPK